MVSDSRLNVVWKQPTDLRRPVEPQDTGTGPRHVDPATGVPTGPFPRCYPLLLTEDELVHLLRIPEIGRRAAPHNIIQNLKRMHNLPCIHIGKTPLYPFEAVRQWILDKVEKERR